MTKDVFDKIDESNEILKINCKLLLEAFDKLDEDTRIIEFSKMAVASSIIKQVIDSVRELGDNKFTEILAKDEFIADTFRRIGIFNEVGIDLGYTKKVEK